MPSRKIYDPEADQPVTLLTPVRETSGELRRIEIKAGPDRQPPVEHVHTSARTCR
jgi:hypothetical protein